MTARRIGVGRSDFELRVWEVARKATVYRLRENWKMAEKFEAELGELLHAAQKKKDAPKWWIDSVIAASHRGRTAGEDQAKTFSRKKRDPAKYDSRYTTRHRVAKWNIQPTVLQEPRLMRREFPELSAVQHVSEAEKFYKKAVALQKRFYRAVKLAEKKYGGHGPLISGAVREHFPSRVKDMFRKMAHEMSFLQSAAEAHWRASGKRSAPPWRK